ncbi:TonB-dependent receptor [Lutibacter sp. HS1-25]|uniref:SusC/RagA family TonB-linked outer membrane protein n=1 Tax=Lutibacter sp. HS1-25 TaxID=2485000 RepID=UPI0013E97E61|nr:TonB-dependent receptor [Lutibacter sp. HS1-25]
MKQKFERKGTFSGMVLILAILFSSFTAMNAQETITGVVSGTDGVPLPGVSVLQKGTSKGAVTDFDGNYAITLTSGQKNLVFSYVGFKTKEIAVNKQTKINVVLDVDVESLQEVVVIGYAPVAREKVLGAMATVKSDALEQATPTSALDGIQGKMSGVQILTNGGPGGGFDIRVRGVSTFGGGTAPLYVVDGQQLDDIDNLDPNDIESMEVLKDGATAAIYGSKAANGVVLITTKSGKAGELKVDVSSVTGYTSLVGDLRVANTRQRILYEKLRQDNTGNLTAQERDSLSLLNKNSYDLQDLITKSGIRQQINLSLSGGGEKGNFYWNTGYFDESGLVLNSSYKRFNSLLKIDAKFSKKFTAGTKLNATFEDQRGLSESQVFQQLVERIPYYPAFEPNGDYSPEYGGRQNPLAETTATRKTRDYRAQSFSYLQFEIVPKLTIKATLGVNFRLNKYNEFNPKITVNPSSGPTGRERFTLSYDIQQETFMNYANTWGDHTFAAFGGMQVQKYDDERFDSRADFVSDDIHTFNNIDPTTLIIVNGTNSSNSLFSLFGGFNYDYKNKYLVGGTMRRDGSSRFGENNKYGYFPSATIGWRMSNESFLENSQLVNNLLIRASYGVTGNERIGDYDFTGAFLPGAVYNGVNGVYPVRLGNPDLSWENTASANIGIDVSMFERRLNVNIDAWQKTTTDLLANVPLPEESGFGSIRKNVGSVDNKGLDVSVSGTILKAKDFSWNSSFNISFLKNKVTKLDGHTPFESGPYYIEEGQPIGNIYGFKNLGIYQYDESNAYSNEGVRLTPNFEEGTFVNYTLNGAEYTGTVNKMKNAGQTLQGGDIIWEDVDGNFDITAVDRQVIGNGLAKYFGGFSNDFRYKNFRLGLLFDYNFGNDLYRRWDESRNDLNSSGETPGPDRIEGAWKNPGDITVYPRLTRVTQNREAPNSFYVTSGDYIKLRYIKLDYSLPKDVIASVKGLEKVSLSLAVNNVLTWTNYIGYNPELGNRGNPLNPGLDDLRYPNDREIILGLKVQFQ